MFWWNSFFDWPLRRRLGAYLLRKKKVIENIWNTYKSTQFLIVIPNMLSDFINFDWNRNFSNRNLINTSQKGTKRWLEMSVMGIFQVVSVIRVWKVYGFVAFGKRYRLVYKDLLQPNWMDFYRPMTQSEESNFLLTYHWPPMKWRIEDIETFFR